MAKEKIELVSSKDSPTGVAGRRVDGEFNPNIISTAALSSQPDFNIPSVAPSTSVQGELGRLSGVADDFQSVQDAFARQQEERAKQAQSTEAQSFNALQAEILGAPTRSELEAEAFSQKGGVDDLQKELNAITADLRGEQRSLELRLRELDKNPEGLLLSALEDEKRRIQTESLQRQADISIIGMAAQDRFNSAKAIADRAIDAITEQNQKRIDFYQAVYDRNSALFDKAETRAFETAQADRKREKDNLDAEMRTLQNTKLSTMSAVQAEGAPTSIVAGIQAAKTPEEALAAAGSWLNKSDREYKSLQAAVLSKQYDKLKKELEGTGEGLTAEQRKQIAAMPESKNAQAQANLVGNLNRLLGYVKEYGSVNPTDAKAKGIINSLRSQLLIDIAVAGGQGAIQGDEADRYAQIIGDGWLESDKKVIAGLSEAINVQNGKIKSNLDFVEAAVPGAKVGFEPFKEALDTIDTNIYLDEVLAQFEEPEQTDEEAIRNYFLGVSTNRGIFNQ